MAAPLIGLTTYREEAAWGVWGERLCGSPHLLVDPASPVGQRKDATPSGVGS